MTVLADLQVQLFDDATELLGETDLMRVEELVRRVQMLARRLELWLADDAPEDQA